MEEKGVERRKRGGGRIEEWGVGRMVDREVEVRKREGVKGRKRWVEGWKGEGWEDGREADG